MSKSRHLGGIPAIDLPPRKITDGGTEPPRTPEEANGAPAEKMPIGFVGKPDERTDAGDRLVPAQGETPEGNNSGTELNELQVNPPGGWSNGYDDAHPNVNSLKII